MFNRSIEKFWSWFDKKQTRVDTDIYNPEFLNEIDKTISGWGFGWEVGPGRSKPYSLTVSPNGDPTLIDGVNAVTSIAPAFENWEVFSFKQAKSNWDTLIFERNTSINSRDWTYRLLMFPDEEIELEVKADNLQSYSDETKALIVDLVITNLLGESRKMNFLYDIVVVEAFATSTGVTNIEHLPDHLAAKKKSS